MKIHHLQRLFEKLPLDFMEDLKGIDFKTCWYGSAGVDKRPMELLDPSHPDALIQEQVKVFFYTDIEYITFNEKFVYCRFDVDFENGLFLGAEIKSGIDFSCQILFQKRHRDFINKNALRDNHQEKFNNNYFSFLMNEKKFLEEYKTSYLETDKKHNTFTKFQPYKITYEDYLELYEFGIRLVKHHTNDGSNIYCFYIDCDDWTFEQLLIKEKMKINYTVHLGQQVSGPGPRCLGNLQTEYCICTSSPINEITDFEIIPFTKEYIKEFVYSTRDDLLITTNFYSIRKL
jgi:hypothetical protein